VILLCARLQSLGGLLAIRLKCVGLLLPACLSLLSIRHAIGLRF
jgi:hypothetical protein